MTIVIALGLLVNLTLSIFILYAVSRRRTIWDEVAAACPLVTFIMLLAHIINYHLGNL